jgi:hypothetical protein
MHSIHAANFKYDGLKLIAQILAKQLSPAYLQRRIKIGFPHTINTEFVGVLVCPSICDPDFPQAYRAIMDVLAKVDRLHLLSWHFEC